MRVLVTGGAGYIGSVAVECLQDEGHEVHVLDSLWRGHRGAIPADVPIHQANLTEAAEVAAAVKAIAPEAVMHFAGATLVGESVADPANYFAANVVGSHNLLVAMRDADVKRFVFSSTAAVYGTPASSPISEETSQGSNQSLRPLEADGRRDARVVRGGVWIELRRSAVLQRGRRK